MTRLNALTSHNSNNYVNINMLTQQVTLSLLHTKLPLLLSEQQHTIYTHIISLLS